MADLTLSDLVLGKKAPANRVVGGARAMLGQGLGMGWGDEGEAWLRSKLGEGKYEDLVSKIRDEYAQYSSENPYTAGALEFGGGMAPAVAMMMTPGGQPAAVAQTGRASAGMLSRLAQSPMARSALAGGTTGAVAGAGTATEGERGEGAGVGGLMGTGLGIAIPVAMRTGKGGYNWLKERLMPTPQGIQDRASQKMLDALRQAQLTPQQIEAVMKKDASMRVPSTVANVDPAMVDLAEAVAQRVGTGRQQIAKTLNEQKQGIRERTYGQVKAGLKPGDYYADEDRLVKELRDFAGKAYDDAYNVGSVNDPKIMTILEQPEVKSVYDLARQIASGEANLAKVRGQDPSKFKLEPLYIADAEGNIKISSIPDVRTLDYMKRAMDAMIKSGYSSSDATVKTQATTLKGMRNELRDRLKTVVPEYDTALTKYAGDMEVIDAMQAGMNKFRGMDHEEVAKLVKGMSPSEKEAFRTGVARDIYGQIMGPASVRNSAQNAIGSPEMQQKLMPLFETPAHFNLFKAALERESQLFNQANSILANSSTARRAQMNKEFEGDNSMGEAIGNAITGGFWSSLTGLASKAAKSSTMTQDTADKLAGMLMSKNPSEVAATVKVLEDYAKKAAPREARATKAELGTTMGTASAVFPSPDPKEKTPDIGTDIGTIPVNIKGAPDIESDIEADLAKMK
jgi:hypothetical protein